MATPDADGITRPTMKIIEVTNVDFSLRQFLLPLMREMRAGGHEVIGACAEGHFWTSPGPRDFALSPSRSTAGVAVGALACFQRVASFVSRREPDLVHAHMPISGFLARIAAWWSGCRASPAPVMGSGSTIMAIRPGGPSGS